jgi:5-oxoprolinase (ATP-hydrolysing)
LPDVTLIKPVFYRKQLVGFVANRAHHAEIGGTQPGSMPAHASALNEEGVVIPPTYLVIGGRPRWEEIEQLLVSSPYPTRAVQENLADMNGALASVTLGAESLCHLCEKFGPATIHQYMLLLRKHAAALMRRRIQHLPALGKATEYLDDGTILKVVITRKRNQLHLDFGGSAPVHKGNMNATQAIVHSVVLYVLRLLVGEHVPLNEGLLQPVRLTIPRGILNPMFSSDSQLSPAVVGGNTEISQRLTDTLLKAFKLAACSQGTMNNLLFGNETFGYYETICGGVGAGPGFHGADAVHQHMTNTRITDPEIIEFRYPVRLEKFEIRKGSGGRGQWNGGEGVVRQFFFKDRLDVNILSQHRVTTPYGMRGGGPGKPGQQFYWSPGKRKKRLAGIQVLPGDRISLETPGGGGWGRPKK